MDEWWITGLEEAERESQSPKSTISTIDNFAHRSFDKKLSDNLEGNFYNIDEHFRRIRNIILAPFAILLLSAFVPPAAILVIIYPIYMFYSFLVTYNELRGKNLVFGFLIGNLLLLPASASAFRTWVYDNPFSDFSSPLILLFIPLSYIFYLLFALDSNSDVHKKTSIGMFYGILFGIIIFFFANIIGLIGFSSRT
tara:strand:- start:999 stop:1586 length:588 start_codon:yes stop_codon:yes gene_type:complete